MNKPKAHTHLPVGIVTFLFTDIEGSTQLWEQAPEETMQALAQHDEIIERVVVNNRGVVVRPRGEGDSRFAVFEQAGNAVAAAADIQKQFYAENWPTPRPLKVRMAMHTGKADLRMGDYYGSAVNRCARLRSIIHGGQTVLSQATWELVHDSLPAGVFLRDEGEHRLKDLTRPEYVYQLLFTDFSQDFPPLRSLTVIPNNLPILLTDFVGRKSELKEIRRSFERSRLLTLVGPGGIGKSRLAIETAAKLADQFRHGVFFIRLAPIASADDVAQAIAEGIGLSLASDNEPQEQLLNYLNIRHLLLVIDNFEHVIDAAGLVDEILRGAPDVKILATSRIKMNLNGEVVFVVQGLHTEGQPSVESYIENEAAQLFVTTARSAKPGFAVSQSDLEPLNKILSLVQGSPLGILLAASWVDMLTVEEIANEIARDFDFLETEMRNVPDRHRSVRATFNYSWRLLAQAERELFSALSVFRGGFTRQAAQEVAGASLRQLANLANKSFLSTSPSGGRYFVHELLRQFGEEVLRKDTNRYDAIKTAHDRYFASFMDHAWYRITHDEQREALLDINADIENVRTAWRHLIVKGDPAEALMMSRSLWFIYEVRGWHVAGAELFGEAVRNVGSRPQNDSLRLMVAVSEAAESYFVALLGRPDAGVALAERATSTLRELERADELVFAYSQMFMSLYLSTQISQLKQIGQEVLILTDDPWFQALVHDWLSFIARTEGNFDEQETHNIMVTKLVGSNRDYFLLYWWHLGNVAAALGRGDVIKSRQILEQALEIVNAIEFKRGMHLILYYLGITARSLEDYTSAEAYLLESMQASVELGGRIDNVSALVDLALTLSAKGEMEQALEMAATAYAHPLSGQNTIWNTEPVKERAEALRSQLKREITPEEAAAAWQRGLVADYDRVVAGLLETSPRGGDRNMRLKTQVIL